MHTLARRSAALSAILAFAVSTAVAQTTPDAPPPAAPAAPADATTQSPSTVTIPTTNPATTSPNHDGITPGKKVAFHFQDAPIESVLNYLSEALDYVVVKPGHVDGRVTVNAQHDVTGPEAVDILNTILKSQNLTIQVNGRVLNVVPTNVQRQQAPVFFGADPAGIPTTDTIRTQVIPVKSVDATKLKNDLQPLLSPDATVASNQGSNTIIVTDTAASIHRMVEIIAALDQHRESVSDIKVFPLKYADATNTAKLINDVFKQDATSGQQQPGGFPFGGGRFGRFFGPGGPGAQQQQSNNEDVTIGGKINASADDRTNTVVVSGPTAMLDAVAAVIHQIDANPAQDTTFFIYNLKNGQAVDIEPVVNAMFGVQSSGSSSTSSRSSSSSSLGSFGSSSGRSSLGGGSFGSSSSSSNRQAFGQGNGYRPPTFNTGNSNGTNNVMANMQGEAYVVANIDTNSLVVTCKAAIKPDVIKILDDLDRPVPQVLIKCLIAEVTHNDSDDIGVELSALDQRLSGNGITAGSDFGIANSTTSGGLKIGLIEQNASATLQALASNNKLDVLSRPYILTSDNQEASMIVGQEVPIITNSQITDTGQTINSVSYNDVGIILDVTPHINPDGMVTLDVAPQISQLDTGSGVPISSNVNAPVFDIRAAESRVGVEDGKTIVIGGLMQDQKQQVIQKIPVLGDIPYLGMLFKRTQNTKTKTELLIFLTPHVAQRPGALVPMSQDEERGTKLVPNAVSPGTFQDQMRGMERGGLPPRNDIVQPPAAPGTK